MSAPDDSQDTSPAPSREGATVVATVVVEHELRFTLPELARASRVDLDWLQALVDEGALRPEPAPAGPAWFGPDALRRAQRARRLVRDFALGAPEAALVLDLLDEIEDLRRRLAAAGA